MRTRLLALLVCAGAVAGATPAAGARCAGLPKHSKIPVVDAANVVDPQDEAYLAADLMAYHVMGNEALVAATVPTTDGDDISSYARRLFDCWGIGEAESDNGVLILVAVQDRRVRIEAGAGLADRLGEAELEAAIDEMVAPLRRGDVGAGLRAAAVSLVDDLGGRLPDTRSGNLGSIPTAAPGDVDDVVDDVVDEPAHDPFVRYENLPVGVSPFAPSRSPGLGIALLVPVIVVLGVVVTVVRAVLRAGLSAGGSAWGRRLGGGYGAGWGAGSMFRGGGWHQPGSSGWPGAGWTGGSPEPSGWSGGGSSFGSGGSSFGSSGSFGGGSSSGGGGGSSFGGGSSGGGGASGSW